LTYYTRKESRVQIAMIGRDRRACRVLWQVAVAGEHTRLGCWFRRLAETNFNRPCYNRGFHPSLVTRHSSLSVHFLLALPFVPGSGPSFRSV